jgi:polyphosphate kinase 2 (PPK2 family)
MELSVEHYLRVYSIRKALQEDAITEPSEKVKKFTSEFLDILKNLPLKEEIVFYDNSFYDSKGNLLIQMPSE